MIQSCEHFRSEQKTFFSGFLFLQNLSVPLKLQMYQKRAEVLSIPQMYMV